MATTPSKVRFLVGCFTEQLPFLMDPLCENPIPSGLSMWEMDYDKIGRESSEPFAKQIACIASMKSPSTVHYLGNGLVVCGREINPSDGSDGLSGNNSDVLNVTRIINNDSYLEWSEQVSLPRSWCACRLHSRMIDGQTYLFTANYHSSDITVFRLIEHGQSLELFGTLRSGLPPSQVNLARQQHGHVHDVSTHPRNNRVLFANHLGSDALVRFNLSEKLFIKRNMNDISKSSLKLPPGCGPRSMVFHPLLDIIYVSCELTCQLAVISADSSGDDEMRLLQMVSILPPMKELTPSDTAGTVIIDAKGNNVFASVRGSDSLFAAQLDSQAGLIKEDTSFTIGSNGRTPRFITLDPFDRYLMAANHDGEISNISVFAIERGERQTQLKLVDYVNVGCPTWIEFLPNNDDNGVRIRSRL